MTKDDFTEEFKRILWMEHGKRNSSDITVARAIEIIERIFDNEKNN